MIEPEPDTWRGLQDRVALILTEAGVSADVEKEVMTARGVVTVDVWAIDQAATPSQVYLVECKHWQGNVTQTIVHAFRTVVGDSGANWGAIVSLRGFQAGAHDAARYSNVRLLTWVEFQALFAPRWFERHFLLAVAEACDPLLEYTEPINSRIARKAGRLDAERHQTFLALRRKYESLTSVCVLLCAHAVLGESAPRDERVGERLASFPALPLRLSLSGSLAGDRTELLAPILGATFLREVLDTTVTAVREAVAEFDSVFGQRA